MRNKDRIDKMLLLIERLWKKYPDLRLGQIILNVVPEDKLYYIEDDVLYNLIKERYNIEED